MMLKPLSRFGSNSVSLSLSLLLFLCIGLVSHSASAETTLKVRLKSVNAFSGSVDSTIRLAAAEGTGDDKDVVVNDLQPTLGAALQFELSPIPYFSVGWLLGLSTWRSENDGQLNHDRSTFIDLDLLLRGQYCFLDDTLSVYLLVPIGLSVNRFSEDTMSSMGADFGHGVGFNVSTLLGLEFEIVDGFGIFAEGGWVYRDFVHTAFTRTFGRLAEVDYSAWAHQWGMNAGVAFSL
ncbi:MAG: hypothetical protein RBU37_11075 [Myxococcota bacterium]|jgi:hypothetical protein|nr:hypothetical protein [Myxococcota bacterium]